MEKINKFLSNQNGFSLIEVMVAFLLFAVFVSSFLVSQGYNISDSALNEEQLKLQLLAENTMNEFLINPPKFTNASESKETKTFEEDGYENYSYTIEIKELIVPDFSKLFNSQQSDEDEGGYFDNQNNSNRNSTIEQAVFQKLKENMEKMLWQVKITITNKETDYSYALSRWVTNYEHKVQLNVGI